MLHSTCPPGFYNSATCQLPLLCFCVSVSNIIGPAKSIPVVEFAHASRQLFGNPNFKKASHVESSGDREPSAEVCLGMQSSGHVPPGSTTFSFQAIDLKGSSSRKSEKSKSNSSSSSRLEKAQIKLRLARLEKEQNEQRISEELEAVEIKRKNILAEDNRRIKMADLEASLNRDSRDSDDDLSLNSSYCQSRPAESNVDVLPSTTLATQEASGVLKRSFPNSQPFKQVKIDAPSQTIDCIGSQVGISRSNNLPSSGQLSCPVKYADYHFNQFQVSSSPSMTPFDQVCYGKYSGFSSSMLPHSSLSNANQEETYSYLATRVQNLATGDHPNKPLPSSCDANQRPYSTEENNHLMTGHFSGTSIPVSKNYNPYSKLVADATKSGRPLTVDREYDNLRFCLDQFLPKPKI